MSATTLTDIATFAVSTADDHVPAAVLDAASDGAVDLVGVTLGGASEPAIRAVGAYVHEAYRPGEASVVGTSVRLAPEGAALWNGVAAHALDYDDHHEALEGHPSAPVLPAALALAEAHGRSVGELLAAYAVGVEVACAFGRWLNPGHYERGWHPTATLGIFGAVAASARLSGCDVETTRHALAIAASLASGIKGNFGTGTKPLQVGLAASKAVQAVGLARCGLDGSAGALHGVHSFPRVFDALAAEPDAAAFAALGRWEILDPGLGFKLYPCCRSAHAAIEAALALGRRAAGAVARIDVAVPQRRLPHIDRPEPRDGIEARLSLQFLVAHAFLRHAVDLATFGELRWRDPDVRAAMERVHARPLDPAEQRARGLGDFGAVVKVRLEDGTIVEEAVRAPSGSTDGPRVTPEALEAKFLSLGEPVVGAEQARTVYRQLRQGWEEPRGVEALMAGLRPPNGLLAGAAEGSAA